VRGRKNARLLNAQSHKTPRTHAPAASTLPFCDGASVVDAVVVEAAFGAVRTSFVRELGYCVRCCTPMLRAGTEAFCAPRDRTCDDGAGG
jgi:hypothetical protein